MNIDDYVAISIQIEEAEKPGNAIKYYQVIQGALPFLKEEMTISIDLDKYKCKYIQLINQEGTFQSLNPLPDRNGFIFNLLGKLEVFDKSNSTTETAYGCAEYHNGNMILYWVNTKGRMESDEKVICIVQY